MSKTKPLFKKIAPGLEICLFSGLEQNFPPHFHNHYLIGCVLDGKRRMTLAGRECWPGPGDIVLLNPEEVHGCVQAGEKPLCWLGLHFSPDCMKNMATDIAGQYSLPLFKKANWPESPLAADFRAMAGQMAASPNCLQGLARKILGKILFWNRDLAATGQIQSGARFQYLLRHHALALSGGIARQSGTANAGGRQENCGSGHKLRFYGSKPFFKMLQGQDRHNSRRIQKIITSGTGFFQPNWQQNPSGLYVLRLGGG